MAVAPRAGLGWRPVLGSEPGLYLPGQQWPKGSRSARLPNSRLECGVCAWRVFLLMVGCDPTNTTKHTRTALVMSRRNGPRASTVQLGQARLGLVRMVLQLACGMGRIICSMYDDVKKIHGEGFADP